MSRYPIFFGSGSGLPPKFLFLGKFGYCSRYEKISSNSWTNMHKTIQIAKKI